MLILIEESLLYSVTAAIFAACWLFFWYFHRISTSKTVVVLFAADISITIEAALYSDIVLIAILHVITIPAFFLLIYVDLIKQHNTEFRCFLCGKLAQPSEELTAIRRFVNGRPTNVTVHKSCIDLDRNNRKAFSKNKFKSGIPK
jgi:hypothetical protein